MGVSDQFERHIRASARVAVFAEHVLDQVGHLLIEALEGVRFGYQRNLVALRDPDLGVLVVIDANGDRWQSSSP